MKLAAGQVADLDIDVTPAAGTEGAVAGGGLGAVEREGAESGGTASKQRVGRAV